MVFYENQTWIGLVLASLPALVGLYLFLIKDQRKAGVFLLLLSALLLRLLMISLDPYVQDWDERFHALVAKHMVDLPFKPMLYTDPVLPYDVNTWSNNHIWVHKQPLFLWQMALSMKLFGISTFAMRLPSALLGVVMVFWIYDIGRKWLKNENVGYLAAFLSCFSWYTLELTSGWQSLDHNDLIFTVYVTGSIWAFVNYIQRDFNWKWAALIGIFAGMAILNKWLVGLLIFGGWGLYLLQYLPRIEWKKYVHLGLGLLCACIVFLPWQFYIMEVFPLESAASYASNKKHMMSDLGHPGTIWYHIDFLKNAYDITLIPFLFAGIYFLWKSRNAIDSRISVACMGMVVVIFAFFSLLVPTKMPAFVFPVAGIMFCLMAFGAFRLMEKLAIRWEMTPKGVRNSSAVMFCILSFLLCKPWEIASQRSEQNQYRTTKIFNKEKFQQLDEEQLKDYVLFNTKRHENIELMFYNNITAYDWCPESATIDSLQQMGIKIAALEYALQPLPAHVTQDSTILIIHTEFL